MLYGGVMCVFDHDGGLCAQTWTVTYTLYCSRGCCSLYTSIVAGALEHVIHHISITTSVPA